MPNIDDLIKAYKATVDDARVRMLEEQIKREYMEHTTKLEQGLEQLKAELAEVRRQIAERT
jgi:uncharacterized lipoprotein YmbA